ncbi:MAG TPA: hypothetical protein DDY68_00815 [Porphyromonadaceae bacterium]|nr:hypothetical protein [Porphyromonadaceae bacterium]
MEGLVSKESDVCEGVVDVEYYVPPHKKSERYMRNLRLFARRYMELRSGLLCDDVLAKRLIGAFRLSEGGYLRWLGDAMKSGFIHDVEGSVEEECKSLAKEERKEE